MLSSKKWIVLMLSIMICLCAILSVFCYIIDPFMYYRMDDSKRILNARWVNIGIIKNYNYDTAIIGSSMVQNFDIESFRQKLGWNPVKLTMGGMNINEVLKMYILSQKYSSAKRYIINTDISTFDSDFKLNLKSEKFPEYLYNNMAIDDIKYLLNYEVWMRFIPANAAINLAYKFKLNLPGNLDDRTKIDKLEDWSKNYKFGKEIVQNHYLNKEYAVSTVDIVDIDARMRKSIDSYLGILLSKKNKEQEIIFMFPPYSALYWTQAKKDGYYDQFMDAKHYFIERCSLYDNLRIVDMQDLSLISDLNHYKDSTHYDTVIQSMIVDAMKSREYDASIERVNIKKNKLDSIVKEFSKNNSDWLD